MNLLLHDEKNNSLIAPSLPISIPNQPIKAILHSGTIIVIDINISYMIYNKCGFGHFIGERQDRVNSSIFRSNDEESIHDSEEANKWAGKSIGDERLRLSAEECFYLVFDAKKLIVYEADIELSPQDLWSRFYRSSGIQFVRRLSVYRNLRLNGWCVRSGLPCGCQYLIYRIGVEFFHATAGVRISEMSSSAYSIIALNRTLTNMRKALIVATVLIPSNIDVTFYECLDSIRVEMNTSKTKFLERKVLC